MPEVMIRVAERGGDGERVDAVARLLRRRLEEIDGVRLSVFSADELPEGARGVDVVVVGAIVATLGDLATHLVPMIAGIREWLDRAPQTPRSVWVELGGDALELSNATVAQQDQLVELFVRRHAGRR